MLFAMVMYRLTNEVKQESQWTIMLTDDTVICSREQVIKSLDGCRYALEKRRTEVSRSRTEYMWMNEMETAGKVIMQGAGRQNKSDQDGQD